MITWRGLVVALAGVEGAIFVTFGAVSRDRESIVIGVVLLVAIGLLRVGRGLVGDLVIAVVAVDIVFWLAPAAIDNLTHRDRFLAIALPTLSALLAVLALVAVVGDIASLRRPLGKSAPTVVAGLGVCAAFMLGIIAASVGFGGSRQLPPGGVHVSARNIEFSQSTYTAPAGLVSIAFRNHDLFWHTFTIDELGVDVRVPVDGERVTTFDAPAGTYRFYCSIPGHRTAGMEGTLVIEPAPIP